MQLKLLCALQSFFQIPANTSTDIGTNRTAQLFCGCTVSSTLSLDFWSSAGGCNGGGAAKTNNMIQELSQQCVKVSPHLVTKAEALLQTLVENHRGKCRKPFWPCPEPIQCYLNSSESKNQSKLSKKKTGKLRPFENPADWEFPTNIGAKTLPRQRRSTLHAPN